MTTQMQNNDRRKDLLIFIQETLKNAIAKNDGSIESRI